MEHVPPVFVRIGKYEFGIHETITYEKNGNLHSRSFHIGGRYEQCVDIMYGYDRNNNPNFAKISMVKYEPECAINIDLEKGGGTKIMLTALLNYVHNKIPSIQIFQMDDESHIDCVEQNLAKPPPRNMTKPMSLANLSIAMHSQTWYEKHFDAKMQNSEQYDIYKNAVNAMTDPEKKVDYSTFEKIICNGDSSQNTGLSKRMQYRMAIKPNTISIVHPNIVKPLYESSSTYQEFFNKIPQKQRSDILMPWLKEFMKFYLIFPNTNWVIDIRSPTMQENIRNIEPVIELAETDVSTSMMKGGGKSKTHQKRKVIPEMRRKTRKHKPRKYRMVNYREMQKIM